jgi:hypothetical protein
MLHILKLLIPALVPSWNFFDIITPSPRVQFTLLKSKYDAPHVWHEFRPRPAHLSFLQMLGRLFWNAKWNESMFVVSCAERLMEQPTQHSENEILERIIGDLIDSTSNTQMMDATYLQFRLLIVERQGTRLEQEAAFYSRIQPLPTQDVA